MENLAVAGERMRILLTGATGFIGRHVLNELGPEHTVVAVTCHAPQQPAGPHVTFVKANLLQKDDVRELVRRARADTLIHLAWHVPPRAFWAAPENRAWLGASLELARAFAEQGGRRMVFAGSGAEYDWNAPMPLREGVSPAAPHSLYGSCKNSLRKAVESCAGTTGLACLWCRIFWPYGPGEPRGKFLSDLIARLHRGERAVCHGANLRRDYIHVQDAARALVLAAVSSLTGIVNIGRGEAVALGDMARMAASATGRPDLLELECARISAETPEVVVASVERLTRELGWKPRWPLSEGIAAMAAGPSGAGGRL